MNIDRKLLVLIRHYLQSSEQYVADILKISRSSFQKIEQGSSPIPELLIDLYASELNVKALYLRAILTSERRQPSMRLSNAFLTKYLGLVVKLKGYDKTESLQDKSKPSI